MVKKSMVTKVCPVCNLAFDAYPSQNRKFCSSDCYHKGHKLGFTAHEKREFIPAWNDELAYLVGAIWGDGGVYYISRRRSWDIRIFPGQDLQLAQRWKEALNNLGFRAKIVTEYKPSWKNRGCRPQFVVMCYRSAFARWLKHLTVDYLESQMDDGCKLAFFRGLFDAEGTIWYTNKPNSRFRARIAMVDHDVLAFCYRFLQLMGFNPTLSLEREGSRSVLRVHRYAETRELLDGTVKLGRVNLDEMETPVLDRYALVPKDGCII